MGEKVIYKYELHPISPTKLSLPVNAKFLKLGVQGKNPIMWVVVNTDNSKTRKEDLYILPVMTGQPVSGEIIEQEANTGFSGDKDGYLGTVQIDISGHEIVLHYFDITAISNLAQHLEGVEIYEQP